MKILSWVLRWFRSPRTLEEVFAKHKIETPQAMCDCPEGWLHLVDQCFYELISNKWDRQLFQVKEKLGGLRIYLGGDILDMEHVNIIARYEHESLITCGVCGRHGTKSHYRIALCDEHRSG